MSESCPQTNPVIAAPVQPSERIAEIDIIRGFAIFGILLVNMQVYGSPIMLNLTGVELFPGWWNQASEHAIRFVAESKFYSMFSFLFGLGFTVQMMRAQDKGVRFGKLFCRRLLVLLGFGLVHAWLLWFGDILTIYALLGFILLLFRKRSPRTLVIWVLILLSISVLFSATITGLTYLGSLTPEGHEQIQSAIDKDQARFVAMGEQALDAYARGSYKDMLHIRIQELKVLYIFFLIGFLEGVLAMFLVGLYVGRRRIHENIEGNLPLIRRVFVWGLIAGLAGNTVYTWAMATGSPMRPRVALFLGTVGIAYGAPALSLAYMSGLILLTRRAAWRRLLQPLASVGRMALTNYLLQTLICTTIFYNYGLGYFGRVGPAAGLLLTVAIYGLQIPLSSWWLKRFRYGPAEWLWRSLTYGQAQHMTVERARLEA